MTSPASIITWWKDGTYISQSQLPWVLEGLSDSELRIVNAMQKDSGSYQCISKTNFSSREPELTVSSPFINVTVEGIDAKYIPCVIYRVVCTKEVGMWKVDAEIVVCLCWMCAENDSIIDKMIY
jgi:hypothetical protein